MYSTVYEIVTVISRFAPTHTAIISRKNENLRFLWSQNFENKEENLREKKTFRDAQSRGKIWRRTDKLRKQREKLEI